MFNNVKVNSKTFIPEELKDLLVCDKTDRGFEMLKADEIVSTTEEKETDGSE